MVFWLGAGREEGQGVGAQGGISVLTTGPAVPTLLQEMPQALSRLREDPPT